MNLKEIREIISLMNENDITEVELEREGTKIKLRKGSFDGYEPIIRPHIEYRSEPSSGSKVSSEEPKEKNSHCNEISSPMVGTFYRAPSPESPNFVDVGQIVEVGQVVCIVEAMKLMNEIKSEIKGKIVEIPVDNAQPVEFGQALFVVEPV